jgi:hypothetical protein
MYTLLLSTHNLLRWAVLIVGIIALFAAYRGWLGKHTFTDSDARTNSLFAITISIQFVVGLLLYFVSPITQSGLQNFGAAMRDEGTRFFLVEHAVVMLLAVGFVHMGASIARKRLAHRPAAIFFTLALLAVVFAIPWWRPLLRGF